MLVSGSATKIQKGRDITMLGRNYLIEMDFLRHQPPIRLSGGRIDVVGTHCMEAVLTVPVPNLAIIEPFKLYDIIVRRHIPEFAKGLPLKVKALGAIALEPRNYIGAGWKKDHADCGCGHDHSHGHDVETDGRGHIDRIHDGAVEVIEEHIPAEIFDCVLFGFGNAAMTDDVIWNDNTPLPFIRIYVNDKGEFVLIPCERERPCGCRKLVVKRTEVIRQPFRAQTLAVKRSATPFVPPQRFVHKDFWTQGSFCECPGRF